MMSQNIGKSYCLHHINRDLHRRVIPDRCLKVQARSLCISEFLKLYVNTSTCVSQHSQILVMVSHQPGGSDVKIGTTRAQRGNEMKELESIYQSHPIPSMPRLTNNTRSSGDSMLAYTERMREISKFRTDSAAVGTDCPPTMLEVQARHIPKAGPGAGRNGGRSPQHLIKPRRPLSLNELIGRPLDKDELSSIGNAVRRKERCMSERAPSKSLDHQRAKKEKDEKRIRISFVSAADLFDLVDFSLRSKRPHNESMKLARAEDTLRLIHEANFFRSMASRQKMKAAAEKEPDVDKASLIVQGTSSPRESPGDVSRPWASKEEKHGEWAKREMQRNSDPYDSDDEGADDLEEEVEDVDLDFDLLKSRRMMLMQPHKLRFRPKRAKRMRLHRSLLSAIPEDERNRQDHSARAQDSSMARLPVIPTSSSLAAIKSSRNASDAETKKSSPPDNEEHCDKHSEKYAPASEDNDSHGQSSDATSKKPRQTPREDPSHSTKKNDSSRKPATGAKTSSLNGQAVVLETPTPRTKAHKKIKKLIFLRDQPDPSYHRYS